MERLIDDMTDVVLGRATLEPTVELVIAREPTTFTLGAMGLRAKEAAVGRINVEVLVPFPVDDEEEEALLRTAEVLDVILSRTDIVEVLAFGVVVVDGRLTTGLRGASAVFGAPLVFV